MTTPLRGIAAPRIQPVPRLLVAGAATAAIVLVLILAPGVQRASAAHLFGSLREPGEPGFIAAHRGDRVDAPENTIAAYRAALESGSTFLETDVQLTADGVPVLMHDATVDRTTNGHGKVRDYRVDALRSLDAGSWFDPAFAGERVPLLDEFLDLLVDSPGVHAFVELKYAWTPDQVRSILTAIYVRGVHDRIVFAAFSPRTLTSLADAAPGIPRAILRTELPEDPVAVATHYGAVAFLTRPSALEQRPEALDELHDAGLGLVLYTLNTEKRWSAALALGVDGMITDAPSALDSWIAATAPGT